MILLPVVISLILEASAQAGASAQLCMNDSAEQSGSTHITDLIHIFVNNEITDIKTKGIVTTSRGQRVVFPGDTVIPDFPQDDTTLSVLDFLSTVYEENDYYESGYRGVPEKAYGRYIYSGLLPDKLDNFVPPVKGKITSGFGFREAYNTFHKGIDLQLCTGDSIMSALPGTVVRTGYERDGYGYFVIISHSDNIETRYAHLHQILVRANDCVNAGQKIALGGNSGNSTGPHLHFEVRYMGLAIDPRRVYDF